MSEPVADDLLKSKFDELNRTNTGKFVTVPPVMLFVPFNVTVR